MDEMKRTDCEFLENVFPNVWAMTSREFHNDPTARADLIASHLKDGVTMQIFEEAIRFNRHLFKGKIIVVLNAGIDLCFSLWAAKYGAKHVYAVDNSQAVDYIKAIMEPNNMSGKITVLKGRIQDIQLPVEQVDLILSNWMGYALLIEDKIQSVIYARDKWLKEGGIIFPDCADLLIAGVQNSKNKNHRIDWWRDVQSFNMNAIRKTASIEPTFQKIDPNEVLTMPVKVWSINLKKLTSKELGFQKQFYIEITRGGYLEGLLTYFDIRFSTSHVPVQFSTSPWAPHTKWLQTVFYFDEPISVNVGEKYHGGLKINHTKLKDGNFATKAYLEFYSGLRNNLNLIFNRVWMCKWMYVDHTDGAVYESVENSIDASQKDNTSAINEKSSHSKDKSLRKPQERNLNLPWYVKETDMLTKEKHDTNKCELLKIKAKKSKKHCKNNAEFPKLPSPLKQNKEKCTNKSKTSKKLKNEQVELGFNKIKAQTTESQLSNLSFNIAKEPKPNSKPVITMSEMNLLFQRALENVKAEEVELKSSQKTQKTTKQKRKQPKKHTHTLSMNI